MIQVIIQPGSIQVTGHAGAGPPGHDLVCAAVSTLVQTFVQSAEQLNIQLRNGLILTETTERTVR